jgi:hypothetical protein
VVVADEQPTTPAPARPEASPGPHGAPDHLRLTDVLLLTEGPEGPTAVPQLALTLDGDGVTVHKMTGGFVWQAPWDQVTELSSPERSTTEDGGAGAVVVVSADSRRHRFVVPVTDPAALQDKVARIASDHGVSSGRLRLGPHPLVAAAVVLVTGAAVAALLLLAGHVIGG